MPLKRTSILVVDGIPFALFHKTPNTTERLSNFLVVDAVMNVLPLSLGMHQAYRAEYPQVLRGNRLLQLQGIVYPVYIDRPILINKFENLDAQRMRKGPHQF